MSKIRIDEILGSRRISNYWWATVIFLGGLGFFMTGLSSYLKTDFLAFTSSKDFLFLPQGITMIFYGTIGLLISTFLWLTIVWNVGSGYNKFNQDLGNIIIFRVGFPGRNRMLQIQYSIKDIQAVKVKMQEGLTPKREIYLRTKDRREIPMTYVGQPLAISDVEERAASLAKFLGVILEGVDKNI